MKSFLSFPESPAGYILLLLPLAGILLVLACVPKTKEVKKQNAPVSYVVHPDWSKSAIF